MSMVRDKGLSFFVLALWFSQHNWLKRLSFLTHILGAFDKHQMAMDSCCTPLLSGGSASCFVNTEDHGLHSKVPTNCHPGSHFHLLQISQSIFIPLMWTLQLPLWHAHLCAGHIQCLPAATIHSHSINAPLESRFWLKGLPGNDEVTFHFWRAVLLPVHNNTAADIH